MAAVSTRRSPTRVDFHVRHTVRAEPRQVWDELIDWHGHAQWIPATWIESDADDPAAVGAHFTAFTGFGRLALEDRMRVEQCAWDDATGSGECTVAKLGPMLRGTARFTVRSSGASARVDWFEDVEVRYLPRFLAPVAARIGARGFSVALGRLDALLERRSVHTEPA